MKYKRLLISIFLVLFLINLGGGLFASSTKVKITFMSTKGEINQQLEEVFKNFSKDYPNITVELIPVGAGQSPFEKLSTMYASGNAPTIAMIDPNDVEKFKDNFLDLSNEKWTKDALKGVLDDVTFEGKVYAFPFALEGYGLIYNKQLIEKAVGKFDPNTIRTRFSLERLFKNLEAKKVTPVVISPLDWSLGAHFITIAYATQSRDYGAVKKFIADLRAGKVDLVNNKVFNDLLDTFDMLRKYNYLKDSPLAGTYEQGAQLLAQDKVAFWFMGNWAWPLIEEVNPKNRDYGFVPVPLDNNPNNFFNRSIVALPTKMLCIDTKNNSKEQQEAAKTLLNWFVYNENGQKNWVYGLNIIAPFSNVKITPNDPLAKSIVEYAKAGRTFKIPYAILPSDHWPIIGAYMQKYLAGRMDRKQLLTEIMNYWTKAK
ncbi:ABC transporter substrate-binding protein [Dictyoglomus thermophilum]|uniref:Bacterial extracellular solute-binding protein, putative n=1 Tax=Dictyoglomus thermophilum (strain ATCC 35947 / DSM 3960 / H-6-12) TaxID=309799 RepID=B5YAW9_DICT6|nr:ABC transporter substrate-binding protein [Dictyoglomus thermophilum]ACI18850.1 bacterial extracellular solute-binding protein, putative [Dictyoglomus thermophilum H-6-12]